MKIVWLYHGLTLLVVFITSVFALGAILRKKPFDKVQPKITWALTSGLLLEFAVAYFVVFKKLPPPTDARAEIYSWRIRYDKSLDQQWLATLSSQDRACIEFATKHGSLSCHGNLEYYLSMENSDDTSVRPQSALFMSSLSLDDRSCIVDAKASNIIDRLSECQELLDTYERKKGAAGAAGEGNLFLACEPVECHGMATFKFPLDPNPVSFTVQGTHSDGVLHLDFEQPPSVFQSPSGRCSTRPSANLTFEFTSGDGSAKYSSKFMLMGATLGVSELIARQSQ